MKRLLESSNSTKCDETDKSSLQTHAIFLCKRKSDSKGTTKKPNWNQEKKLKPGLSPGFEIYQETIDNSNSKDIEATQVYRYTEFIYEN